MLVEKHERALRGFLAQAFGSEVAEDIAQDAFLKAWRGAGQYDGRARYSTWLTRIAWRCRLDAVRRHRAGAADEHPGTAPVGLSTEVGDMLARLSEGERASLVLCEGHGWTHTEAAELLNLPLGTLKSTVARAKAKCRKMWEETSNG